MGGIVWDTMTANAEVGDWCEQAHFVSVVR